MWNTSLYACRIEEVFLSAFLENIEDMFLATGTDNSIEIVRTITRLQTVKSILSILLTHFVIFSVPREFYLLNYKRAKNVSVSERVLRFRHWERERERERERKKERKKRGRVVIFTY